MNSLFEKGGQMINRDRKNNLLISAGKNLSSSSFINVPGILNQIKLLFP